MDCWTSTSSATSSPLLPQTLPPLVTPNAKPKQQRRTDIATGKVCFNTVANEAVGAERYDQYHETDDAFRLKKILEWELSLDARDLRSHAWYHGAISRSKAEQIVGERDGDFLVRDCTSQPGNYVLSCRHKGQNLHFVINKVVLQPNTVYETVQYRFEDDGFDTVPDLITYYVGSGKPITVASAAKIQNPQNRRHPLSFSDVGDGVVSTAVIAESASTANVAKQRSLSLLPGDWNGIVGSVRNIQLTPTIAATGRRASTTTTTTTTTAFSHSFSHSLPRPAHNRRSRNSSRSRSPCNARKSADSDPLRRPSAPTSDPVFGLPNCGQDYANVVGHFTGSDSGSGRGRRDNCRRDEEDAVDDGGGIGQSAPSSPPPKPSRVTLRNDFNHSLGKRTTVPWTRPRNASFYVVSGSDCDNDFDDLPSQSCTTSGAAAAAAAAAIPAATLSTDTHATIQTRRMSSGVVIRNPKYDVEDDKPAHKRAADNDDEVDDNGNRNANNTPRISSSLDDVCDARGVNDDDGGDDDGNDDDDDDDDDDGNINDDNRGSNFSDQASLVFASHFDLDAFHTLLLPVAENKPLDSCALQGVHMLLMDSGSRILANHLTRVDLALTVHNFSCTAAGLNAAMCNTGIELSVLPHGRQHRLDLIERSECLRLLVAVTILTCATELERAELLNKWIQVAIDTKTALGNLFGFCAIMLGLCTPQVQRLNETWHILRQRYTDSAFNFEAKLRPTLKCMNESTNPLAPNTTIPHLLPVILLYERNQQRLFAGDDCGSNGGVRNDDDDNDDDNHNHNYDIFTESSHIWQMCIEQWEASSPDLGLGTLFSHLNATRQFYNLLPTFKRNAEIVLADSKIDHLLYDMFRTEFHLKFLWGSRGSKVNAHERYTKFQQVLDVMSQKCETTDYDEGNVVGTASADVDSSFAFRRPVDAAYSSNWSASTSV